MDAKGFTLLELVILALVTGVITFIALPNFTTSLGNLRASKNRSYVASMEAHLQRLVAAEGAS